MTDQELKLELNKFAEMRHESDRQSRQWHDDFKQRESHWLYMRGFWLVSGGIGIGLLITKFL